jgi:hypothetical protein
MYKNIIYNNQKNDDENENKTKNNKNKTVIIRGKNRSSVIAACIIYACRKKGKTRSPKEMAKLFNLKNTEVTKGCKIFQKLAKLKNIDLKINCTKPEDFITRFCEELRINSEYTKQAILISDNVQKLQIASVHTPLSLATGSIYLMIYINNLDIQKKTIAEKFNVSQVTIAKAFKKLEPFMSILINNEICNRLSIEIKKYQNKIIIKDELKSKFIRFNVDIKKTLNTELKTIYGILEKNEKNEYIINDKLLLEHDTEINYKIKQINSEYINLNLNYNN